MSDLQSKLGGGLNILQDSLQQGKQKLQTAQEISHYKKLIQDNSEQRADLLLKLGEETYLKMRSGEIQNPQLHQYFLEATVIDRKIFQAQKALKQLNMKTSTVGCTTCGSQIGADDKFCGSCGQKQVDSSLGADSANLVICPTCEEQIPGEAKFCACCGSRLVL